MNTDYCFNLAMRKSSRLITQLYEERLKPVGLKVGQFSILRAVFFSGETTNKKLQDILVLDQTTLTRNLKPLFRDEYLKASSDPIDGRLKIIRLTSSGKDLYEQALPLWQQAQLDIVNKLGEQQSEQIHELADRFVKVLGN
ncbi:MAG: MarR family transcriptional regulator [Osedax symbiont Rs2]|nr:MAG: MarR family transcriptional regulator [Osedax symbiont Rs2]